MHRRKPLPVLLGAVLWLGLAPHAGAAPSRDAAVDAEAIRAGSGFTELESISSDDGGLTFAVGTRTDESGRVGVIHRFDGAGRPMNDWGPNGRVEFPCDTGVPQLTLGQEIVVLCDDEIRRYSYEGVLDQTYGGDGVVEFSLPSDGPAEHGTYSSSAREILWDGDRGTFVLAESTYYEPCCMHSATRHLLLRLDAAGEVDETFGYRSVAFGSLERNYLYEMAMSPSDLFIAGHYRVDWDGGGLLLTTVAGAGEGAIHEERFDERDGGDLAFNDLITTRFGPVIGATNLERMRRVLFFGELPLRFDLGDPGRTWALEKFESGNAFSAASTRGGTFEFATFSPRYEIRSRASAPAPHRWRNTQVSEMIRLGQQYLLVGSFERGGDRKGFSGTVSAEALR